MLFPAAWPKWVAEPHLPAARRLSNRRGSRHRSRRSITSVERLRRATTSAVEPTSLILGITDGVQEEQIGIRATGQLDHRQALLLLLEGPVHRHREAGLEQQRVQPAADQRVVAEFELDPDQAGPDAP